MPEDPRPAGPVTLRLRALAGAVPLPTPDEKTVAGIRILGVDHPKPPPTPDPVWSAQHLAALLNAMLYLFLGNDAGRRRAEADALVASAKLKVAGVAADLPMRKDGLDQDALTGPGYTGPWAVTLLQAMVREHYEDADAVHEGNYAERAYVSAVEHTFGKDHKVLDDARRLVGLGKVLRARITVESGGVEGPFELEERDHTIGRSAANDIRLGHASVSRRHARLVPRAGRYVLTDAGSTAGTAVNGERIAGERVLRDGDTIGVGDVMLRFEHVEA